jgi:predicted ATP-dependent endonuclease of OLD family
MMKLSTIQIKNFRSIKFLNLPVNDKCMVLVGENEAGKSNILKALRGLDPNMKFQPDDIRDTSPEEPSIMEAHVEFIFTLDNDEMALISSNVCSKIWGVSKKMAYVKQKEGAHTINEFIRIFNKGLHKVDIIKNTGSSMYYSLLSGKYSFQRPLFVLEPNNGGKILLNGKEEDVTKYRFFDIEEISEDQKNKFSEINIEGLHALIGAEIVNIIKSKLPECLTWQYSDANLLPGKIDYNNFKTQPDSCIPLKNMFLLSGISDITKEITIAESKTNGTKNLLNKVAKNTTNYIQKAWPEIGDLSITLAQNGPSIEAGVSDHYNVFDFSRRSDGFKRFLTFLLIISVKKKANKFSNYLLLIDEPENGLHPSGAKYLMKELINISSENIIFYSTHSIFMIDKEKIERHIIVKKDNENTFIKMANESNILDEEVLFKALGFSFAELLKKRNIIFEGWRDKYLFLTALKNTKGKFRSQLKELGEFGVCHAQGVKNISAVGSVLECGDREFYILSDSDQPAVEAKNRYYIKERWLTYQDILPNSKYLTTEDFINSKRNYEAITKALKANGIADKLTIEEIESEIDNVIALINRWLIKNHIEKETIKNILNDYKNELYNNLKLADITEEYYVFLSQCLEKFDND